MPESVKELLRMNRAARDLFERAQRKLVMGLLKNPLLRERVELFAQHPGRGGAWGRFWR